MPVIPKDRPDGWIDLPTESNWRGVVQIDGVYREVECRFWKARYYKPGFGADITILAPGGLPERIEASGDTEDKTGIVWLHVSSEAVGTRLAGATIRLVSHAYGKALHGTYYTSSIKGKVALEPDGLSAGRSIMTSMILLLAMAAPGQSDADEEKRQVYEIQLEYRLDGLDDRANHANAVYLDILARAAAPIDPDKLVQSREEFRLRRRGQPSPLQSRRLRRILARPDATRHRVRRDRERSRRHRTLRPGRPREEAGQALD